MTTFVVVNIVKCGKYATDKRVAINADTIACISINDEGQTELGMVDDDQTLLTCRESFEELMEQLNR